MSKPSFPPILTGILLAARAGAAAATCPHLEAVAAGFRARALLMHE